ncbi:MAG: hypothetical protein ACP5RH_22870, partial [Leptodesmis sp.]|uniref:hypothetical protein n=1 Tax=Leptodesmis sp. TaxID=3100501 RepID=UPI003D1323C9
MGDLINIFRISKNSPTFLLKSQGVNNRRFAKSARDNAEDDKPRDYKGHLHAFAGLQLAANFDVAIGSIHSGLPPTF